MTFLQSLQFVATMFGLIAVFFFGVAFIGILIMLALDKGSRWWERILESLGIVMVITLMVWGFSNLPLSFVEWFSAPIRF